MSRIAIAILAVMGLGLNVSPAFAQRARLSSSSSYKPTVSRPIESNHSSSPSYSGGYYSSSGSNSYSSSDNERKSDFDFRFICLIIIFISIVVRIIAGVIGFFSWIFRGLAGPSQSE